MKFQTETKALQMLVLLARRQIMKKASTPLLPRTNLKKINELCVEGKELVPAVAELLCHDEHRMCTRHIYGNWAKTYKGDKLQLQFWQLAKSANMADFRIAKEGLLQLTNEGYATLFQLEPKHWCRAFFSEEFNCDNVNNNICEVFNSKIIDARCKPVISMLEDIRAAVMTQLQKQRNEAAK